MTKPKVIFSPVSPEYFDEPLRGVPADARRRPAVLRRGRGLLRPDPARGRGRGVQGPRVVLVGARVRPRHGALRRGAAEVDHLHGPPRSPAHAQPAQQGVHAAGDPVTAGNRRRAHRALPRQGRPGPLRRGAGLLRPVPRRGHHAHGRGARGLPPAGPALDRQEPASQTGSDRAGRRQHAGQHRLGHVLLRPGAWSAGRTRKTT